MKTSLVRKEHIPVVWDRIKKYAEGCAKYTFGRFTAEDMVEGLLTKDQQLWIAFDDIGIHAFWVTEVITYPQIKTLVMHFVGGKYSFVAIVLLYIRALEVAATLPLATIYTCTSSEPPVVLATIISFM